MKVTRIASIFLLGVLLVCAVACGGPSWSNTGGSSGGGGVFDSGPIPQITGTHASEHMGSDFSITVEVTVYNSGDSGNVQVIAEVTSGGWWQKSRVVYMAAGTSQRVDINFPEVDWLADYTYSARAQEY